MTLKSHFFAFCGLDGATIEPLAPLLLLLNDQITHQNTDIEVIKYRTEITPNKSLQDPPVKKRKRGGPKI